MIERHGNGDGSHDDEAADERPMYQRWAEISCTLYRCQSLAKILEKFCDTKAQQTGSNQPLPLLDLFITDIGHMAEVIGLEVDKALTQVEDLRTDYANIEKDVEEP
jgi:hypothetical protein